MVKGYMYILKCNDDTYYTGSTMTMLFIVRNKYKDGVERKKRL